MIRAFRIFNENNEVKGRLVSMEEKDLTPGNVVIRVRYSGVNYKDALAGSGRGRILKTFPLNAGIDAAGVIESSGDPRFQPGQEVLVNGSGIGESTDGGYAEKLRVPGDIVVPKPNGLTLQEAMLIGTAGFTAALAIHRMEVNGQTPTKGPILVTGATGGVGSFAVQILSQSGYEVIAVSGKENSLAYLKELGAKKVVMPDQLALGDRPLEAAKFGGVIDNVGGELLAKALAHTNLWGNVASIGLAASAELHTTVMPFILRGVSILGASSNNCPQDMRKEIWNRLGDKWKPAQLQKVLAKTITLDDLPQAFQDLLDRKVTGRMVVVL
jgi:NADPH2:quinone reductase